MEQIDTNQAIIKGSLQQDCQILEISGKLVYQNIPAAKEQLNNCWADAKHHILDCTKLERIDSTGFGLIFNMMRKKTQKSCMAVVVQDPFIAELFSITKVHLLMPVTNSIEAAKAALCE